MTRVLLLGTGPLPDPGLRTVDFPRLRTWQFLRGLLEAGVEVVLITAGADHGGRWRQARLDSHSFYHLSVSHQDFDRPDLPERWVAELNPSAVVSAGPFAPARAAARVPEGRPVFIDLPGDMMAEAQLRAAASGEPVHVEHAFRILSSALARGDAFSVVSERQRLALLGQMGVLGRLTGEMLEWQDSASAFLPSTNAQVAAGVRRGRLAGRAHSADPGVSRSWAGGDVGDAQSAPYRRTDGTRVEAQDSFVIPVGVEPSWMVWASSPDKPCRSRRAIWPGAMNTWADIETFFQACELALERSPSLEIVVTGGPIRGHEEAAYARFSRWVAGSRWKARYRLTGWIEAAEAAREVVGARVGISLDRRSPEAVLGSRTRLIYGAVLGLPWITTSGCELADYLVELGWAREVPFGDAGAVCDAMLAFTEDMELVGATNHVRSEILEQFSISRTMAPLVEWLRNPVSKHHRIDLNQGLLERVADLEHALAAVHNSPTWRIMGGVHRLIRSLVRGIRR